MNNKQRTSKYTARQKATTTDQNDTNYEKEGRKDFFLNKKILLISIKDYITAVLNM